MRKLLIALFLLIPFSAHAQYMGQTVIVGNGNAAYVTSGHALQVDLYSVGGTTISLVSSGIPVYIEGSGITFGGTSAVDEASFTLGSGNGTPGMCYYQTTVTTGALTSGQVGVVQCDANRRLFVVGAGSAGTAAGGVVTVQGVASMTPIHVTGNAGGAFDAATGAAPPANAVLFGGLAAGATGGYVIALPICDSYKPINVASATTTSLISGVSGRQIRLCAVQIVTAAANNVALIEGTTSSTACDTGAAGLAGGTSAASGYNFAAAGGITEGSGIGTVMRTATTADNVCMVTSTSAQVSGGISYTIY